MPINRVTRHLSDLSATQQTEPQMQSINDRQLDDRLDSWLRQTQVLAESMPLEDVRVKTQLITLLKKLEQRRQLPGFRLAIVGEFSRGKSCLINRLLEREDLLPVSAAPTKAILTSIVAGAEDQMKVSFDRDNHEVRSLSPSAWEDLLATDDHNSSDRDIIAEVRMSVDQPWLRSLDVELLDTPGAGDLNQRRAAIVFDLLSQCDAAVLVVSATIPFSLTEAAFLEQEVIGRHVPRILVVVSKLDTIPMHERESIFATVRARVAKISPAIPVLPSYPVDSNSTEADVLSTLRTEIAALVKSDRRQARNRQVAGQLRDCLNQICKIGSLAISSQRMSSSGEEVFSGAQKQLRQADLKWENLHIELERLRLKRDRTLQQRIMQAKTELLEVLNTELSQASQPKTWWERDLPVRLRRELIALARKSEDFLIEAIAEDFAWLQREISRVFATDLSEKNAPSWEKLEITPELAQIDLANTQREQILTRIGSSAAAVCGYVLAGPVGIILSTSVWLVGEQILARKVETQRQLLSGELGRTVNSTFENYCDSVCDRLRQLYNNLASDTHDRQSAWQSVMNAALETSNSETNQTWQQLIKQATALNQEISTAK